MIEEIKPGDTVQVKSGGPHMTVDSIDDGEAICVWFDKTTRKSGRFSPLTIIKSAPAGVAGGAPRSNRSHSVPTRMVW